MPLDCSAIAKATRSPLANVEEAWPLIVAALREQGIDSDLTQVAAAATVAVETGNTFKPIREKLANPEHQPKLAARQAEYAPYTGRGYIQLTWRSNYETVGNAFGVDLVGNPDLLLEPAMSAKALAWFFRTNRINSAADGQEWMKVRMRVNGGLNGWEEFKTYITRLLEATRES